MSITAFFYITVARHDGAAKMVYGPVYFKNVFPRVGELFNFPGDYIDGISFTEEIASVEWGNPETVWLTCKPDVDVVEHYDDDVFWDCAITQPIQTEIKEREDNDWELVGDRRTHWDDYYKEWSEPDMLFPDRMYRDLGASEQERLSHLTNLEYNRLR